VRYLVKLSYDGSNFFGYQKQPGLRTVEEELENALYSINNHTTTRVFASGRTDRGVHALGQRIHFDLNVNISLYKLKCAMNSLLPDDIHVISIEIVDKDFHARFSVKEKTYIYKLNVGEFSPINRKYIYQYNKDLNIEKMSEAIKALIGEHDFKSFVSEDAIKDDYTRIITRAEILKKGDIITFVFSGNGFMKYQVRNMVGTLIKVGNGKIESNEISNIFKDPNKKNIVSTAKPEGLYLIDVCY